MFFNTRKFFRALIAQSFSITAYELALGKRNFDDHYLRPDGATNFRKQIDVDWAEFRSIFDTLVTSGRWPGDLALRFIHRYDVTAGAEQWHMCMAVCDINQATVLPVVNGKPARPIREIARYDLKHGAPITSSRFAGDHDPVYFTLLYADAGVTPAPALNYNDPAKKRHVRNLVMPWVEILEAYNTNEAVNLTPISSIRFSSCSFDSEDVSWHSEVRWPHGLVVTFIDQNGTELISDDMVTLPYFLRGANLATLCPPSCDQIVSPY